MLGSVGWPVAAVLGGILAAAVWVNGSLVAEKQAAVRHAQVERADYRACVDRLVRAESSRAARR